jgi:hypothetical protein
MISILVWQPQREHSAPGGRSQSVRMNFLFLLLCRRLCHLPFISLICRLSLPTNACCLPATCVCVCVCACVCVCVCVCARRIMRPYCGFQCFEANVRFSSHTDPRVSLLTLPSRTASLVCVQDRALVGVQPAVFDVIARACLEPLALRVYQAANHHPPPCLWCAGSISVFSRHPSKT